MIVSGTMVFYGASMSDTEMAYFTVRIPKEYDEELAKIARAELRSKASLIATILQKYLKDLQLEKIKTGQTPHLET